ncbi:MAG: D-amino acid dehydrogenase [Rhodospirillaceae bacterium]|jgi:D-amino-acid dehydrogenase|nr:D-amino acid dehydrogenase [Rhodospirillaceae bacterium]
MKTIIMGGGVVGMTMAYFLAKDGHEVTVIERNEAAGRETSFQNAGLIATAHSSAWASPRSPGILIRSLFDKNAALVVKPRIDFQMMGWGLKFLRECTAERFRVNTLRKLRICKYSEQFMPEVAAETGIEFHHLTKGLFYCFRDQAHFDEVSKGPNLLAENGVEIQVLTPDEMIALDPAFAPYKGTVVGALYCPTDGSGDARIFTEKMAEHAQAKGAKMEYNTAIKALRANASEIEAVITDKGEFTADNYVLSCGAYSPLISKTVGVPLPIYPVKGYTADFPCDEGHDTPEIGGVDEDVLVAWGKFGDRFRVGGKAVFAGYDTGYKPSDFTAILNTAKAIFPNSCDWTKPSYWACVRPMTPDGPPIFGTAKYRNFWLNTGHGHIGWTMACGSARIVADMMLDRKPAIDIEGLTLAGNRYAGAYPAA